jgi:hypothetical protein
MGKLKCKCGHIIVDQTDNLSYKGYILPDNELDNFFSFFEETIDKFSNAIKTNSRIEWIKQNFSFPPYPTNLNDSSMIHDLLSGRLIDKVQDIFECENCGRIAIETGQKNNFKFYAPDDENTKGILNVTK